MSRPTAAQRSVLEALKTNPQGQWCFNWRTLRVFKRNAWIEAKNENGRFLLHITQNGLGALNGETNCHQA